MNDFKIGDLFMFSLDKGNVFGILVEDKDSLLTVSWMHLDDQWLVSYPKTSYKHFLTSCKKAVEALDKAKEPS